MGPAEPDEVKIMTNLLEVRDLRVSYGAVVAVRDVSLDLEEGRTLAVLGANGAGKTSLLRAVSGLEPFDGTVTFDGEPLPRKPHLIARRGIAHVPDDRGLFPTLTVRDNLRMGLVGAGRDADHPLDEVHELFPILAERADQAAGTMSGGQQQMLTIARALLQEPRLLMLDEMSMGLAPAIVDDLFDIVRDLQARGITIVLVEQFVGQALAVADRVLVLEQGCVVADGTPDELDDDELAGAYLGGEASTDVRVTVPPAPDHVVERMEVAVGGREARALARAAARRGVDVDELLRDAARRVLDEEVDP